MPSALKLPERAHNHAGEQHHGLQVTDEWMYRTGRKIHWRCTCECGNSVWIYTGVLGVKRSCGCHKRDLQPSVNVTGFDPSCLKLYPLPVVRLHQKLLQQATRAKDSIGGTNYYLYEHTALRFSLSADRVWVVLITRKDSQCILCSQPQSIGWTNNWTAAKLKALLQAPGRIRPWIK